MGAIRIRSKRPRAGVLVLAFVAASTVRGMQPNADRPGWISVGPNVRVSAEFPNWEHAEYMADADPTRPGGLVVCSMMFSSARNQLASTVYVSGDGGSQWKAGMRDTTARFGGVWDPACGYGTDGAAYFLTLVSIDSVPVSVDASPTYESWPRLQHRRMPVYRSTDGGRSWSLLTRLGFIDNEDFTVDRTHGRFAGRIYVYGNNNRAEPRDLWLLHSSDGGKTFVQSARTVLRDTTYSSVLHAGPGAVTPAGTLALPFYLERRGVTYMDRTLTLAVARSTDGGEQLSEPAPVAVVPYCTRTSQSTEGVVYATVGNTTPMLAADHSNGPFRGRVYAVWGQMFRAHCAIMAAYSDDDGRSWSRPAKVSDERPRVLPAQGPDAFLPTIAVNSAGVVGVTWYDRREDFANRSDRLRFSASVDGGESWSPSVPVSERANVVDRSPRYPAAARGSGGGTRRADRRTNTFTTTVRLGPRLHTGWNDVHGDYAAIAAGADGRFHAFWIDNRTGVAQFYSAAVSVSARPEENAGAARGGLVNVTPLLELQYTSSVYDAASKTVFLQYRILNTSSDTIAGPLRMRITALDSDLGTPRIGDRAVSNASLGSDRTRPTALEQTYYGNGTAIVEISDAIPVSGLAPGMVTNVRSLRVRFAGMSDIIGTGRWNDVLRFDSIVYGVVRSPRRTGARADKSVDVPAYRSHEPLF
jgi:hypothetical protein